MCLMAAEHPLFIVFFSHSGVLEVLDALKPVGDHACDVLVEVGGPSLGLVTDEGVEAVGWGTDARGLARRVAGVSAPVIPAVAASDRAVMEGVRALQRVKGRHRGIMALIHLRDAERFVDLVAEATKVAVLWDADDLPTSALGHLGSILDTEDVIAPGVWCGLHVYIHPDRRGDEATSRLQALAPVLEEYADLVRVHR